jgi:molybdopterin-guanine dinucleotide biosynthesis protein A
VDSGSRSIRGIPDVERFGGPLHALPPALEASGTTAIVVGGDMPDLVPDVLRLMLARLDADPSIDALILARANAPIDEARQVLPMAIRVGPAVAASRSAIADGRRSLRSLLDHLAWAELPASDWLPLDPAAATLLDVDTRADLERIRAGQGH